MSYNVVTNMNVMKDIKKSPHFRTNLGLVNTIEKNGNRVYNDRDKFSHFYNVRYKTTTFGQGNIGDIMFYVDHYIRKDQIAFYKDSEEFIFDYDPNIVMEKGINFYLGYLLKEIETKLDKKAKKAEKDRIEKMTKTHDPNKLKVSPGQVRYEDLEAYIREKRGSL
jgi:hypothetical protein